MSLAIVEPRRIFPSKTALAIGQNAQLVAEGDKSPGVLLVSGYIAGGAIAGILIAFMAGLMGDFTERVTTWSTRAFERFPSPLR